MHMSVQLWSKHGRYINRHTFQGATVTSVTLFFAVTMGALFNVEGPCVDSLVTQTAELNDVFRGGEGGECAQLAASLEVVISEVSALREAPLGHERGHCHFSAVAAGTPSASHKPQMITDNFCCATVSGNYQGKGWNDTLALAMEKTQPS